MAGFEIIVRPVVFPNIRPTPARSLPPQDDPDKGFAVIRGNGAKMVSLSNSYSSSTSSNKRQETKRRVDELRVYQKEDNGTVNRDNFVDIERVNKLWMKGPAEPVVDNTGPFSVPEGKGFFTPTDKTTAIEFFDLPTEQNNIEIRKRNKIIAAGQVPGG